MITNGRDERKAYFMPSHVLVRFEVGQEIRALPGWLVNELGRLSGVEFNPNDGAQIVVPLRASKETPGSFLVQLTFNGRTYSVGQCVLALSDLLAKNKGRWVFTDTRDHVSNPQTFILTAVAPNWLNGGAGEAIITGGPGTIPTRPQVVKTGAFSISGLTKCTPNNDLAGQSVHVFVLDTLPGPRPTGEISRSTPEPETPNTFSTTARLNMEADPMGKLWLEAIGAPQDRDLSAQEQECESELTRWWADERELAAIDVMRPKIQNHRYSMSDHGLFVAGIIKRIAPKAHIHLIQVLNAYGIGTLTMMAAGFNEIARFRQKCGDAVCIINCSFTLTIPVLEPEMVSRWKQPGMPHNSDDMDREIWCLLRDPAWMGAQALIDAIVNLKSDKCRIVAAAGNDSLEHPPRIPRRIAAARYPARLESVLGVGALDANGDREEYSNYPDSPVSQGLMTLGALRGLFTGAYPVDPILPSYDTALGDGLADWGGTSFATPVITGALAKLGNESGLSLGAAEACLRGMEGTKNPDTGGEVVTVTQS